MSKSSFVSGRRLRRGARAGCPWIARSFAVAAAVALLFGGRAEAGFVPVFGGMTFTEADGWYSHPRNQNSTDPGGAVVDVAVNSSGTAVGWGTKHKATPPHNMGDRSFRWDGTGARPVDLGHLGTFADGSTFTYAMGLNETGRAVGTSYKFDATGRYVGRVAVRWEPGGTTATELEHIGASANGTFHVEAYAVNSAGVTVGTGQKYVGGVDRGNRAIRWDAAGAGATELGHLGTSAAGKSYSGARGINDAGTIVGSASKYDSGGKSLGGNAVRWDPGTIEPVELGHLGTDASGAGDSAARLINAGGTIVGDATKYVGGASRGRRAVRWAAGDTTTVELDVLGADADGTTTSRAAAMNDAGAVVGYVVKYDPSGVKLGDRAVRWDATTAAVTELGGMGASTAGLTDSRANDVDAAGGIVGYTRRYNATGVFQDFRAVYWPAGSDSPADLNTLIDPTSGWVLRSALAISDEGGWIVGVGTFDPDGYGGEAAYYRLFLLQVPEPAGLLAMLAPLGLARRPRGRRLLRR